MLLKYLKLDKYMKIFLTFSFITILFSSCEKTKITNDEIRNLLPGGTVTLSITSPNQGIFSLINDTFPSYGCYNDEGENFSESIINFYVRVSGKKNNMVYYFQGSGSITKTDMKYLKSNPNQSFSLQNVKARIVFKNGANVFFTTYPNNEIPGIMDISNIGEVGDPVTVNFNFQTSNLPGFSDMFGTVNTHFVIYNY
jgi:hypothetical protein